QKSEFRILSAAEIKTVHGGGVNVGEIFDSVFGAVNFRAGFLSCLTISHFVSPVRVARTIAATLLEAAHSDLGSAPQGTARVLLRGHSRRRLRRRPEARTSWHRPSGLFIFF